MNFTSKGALNLTQLVCLEVPNDLIQAAVLFITCLL